MYRVRQFFKGLTAYGYKDYSIPSEYLCDREKELFFRLPAHERRHAIDTANTIRKFDIRSGRDMLIKAALLHDIGKSIGNIGIIKKSLLVLMDKFMPAISIELSQKFSMFYIYYNHPEIGASLLKEIGTEERIVLLVKYHHSEEKADIEGMDMLKKADSLN